MNIPYSSPLSFIVIMFFSVAQHALAKSHEDIQLIQFMGTAYALDQESGSESFLYTEHHRIYQNSQGDYVEGQVEYRDAEGELFASKSLIFSKRQTLPELRFDDLRTNHSIATKNKFTQPRSIVQLTSQERGASNRSEVEIETLTRSVVDAGFDLFVLKNWDALLKGKKVKLDFLALTRASFYGFYLEKENEIEGNVVISLKPSSFFLGLLMEPIKLTYDTASKRLLRFEGLTNIEKVVEGKAKGENYLARIEYVYLK